MLAIDLLEPLRGRLVVLLLVQQVEPLVVKLVGRIIEDLVLLGAEPIAERAERAAPTKRRDQQRQRKHTRKRGAVPTRSSQVQGTENHTGDITVSTALRHAATRPCAREY